MSFPADPSFCADLHVHSKYSRATSRDLDLEHLAWWAARKGIRVVGTGDCVHPHWLAEIRDKLVAEGNGLFRLRADIAQAVFATLPPACRQPVSFMLSTEISTIYKKGDKTRKIHHLIYLSGLEAADRLAGSLGRIGNIASDGRPILGLDSRDLLEIALDSAPDSYLVPAHIWTPWFAALGSQSGFDSIAECYGDLAPHIFAVETGLSSDPAMNWRVSFLDRYRLTSSSDAHSPGKLGREATRFSCAADYAAIRRALETGEGYGGTVEFFPEEGKYHLDGHRACGVRLDPKETLALDGRCPVCGGRVTVGVAHRVEMLADRSEAAARPPHTAGPVASLVPLPEILSEIVGSGVASGAVMRAYDRTGALLGPELSLLGEVPVEDIARVDPLMGEAVARLRAGHVIRQAGYDGEYGVIRLFQDGELARRTKGDLLFEAPVSRRARPKATPPAQNTAPGIGTDTAADPALPPAAAAAAGVVAGVAAGVLAGLDADQAAAAVAPAPLMVLAGPGAGKTRMLTCRLARLVLECGVPAPACLAVTFTRKATDELRARLAALLGRQATALAVHSFHSLGLAILRAESGRAGLAADFRVATPEERRPALAAALGLSEAKAATLLKAVSVLKRTGAAGGAQEEAARAALEAIGRETNSLDFDDLVCRAVALLEGDDAVAARWRARFAHIVADEFQDVDEMQYRLLRTLAGPEGRLCVIGDPDQAIYGFRGADAGCFDRFRADYPHGATLRLARNYRSTATIVAAAAAFSGAGAACAMRPAGAPVTVHAAADERAEADYVAAATEALIGGHDMLAVARARPAGGAAPAALGFADIAVLCRTDAETAALRAAFDRAGIPHQKSTPAPLSGHPGVVALLAAAGAAGAPANGPGLAQAAEAARRAGADAAAVAQARGWLEALAARPSVAGDPARLADEIALATEADFRDPRADRVSLFTMHAAKGLEFAVVFVTGLEAGLVPFAWDGAGDDDPAAQAGERRLFYVAMTRARDRLFLTRAGQRFRHGAVRARPPSPFLGALPAAHVAGSGRPAGPSPGPRQLSLF